MSRRFGAVRIAVAIGLVGAATACTSAGAVVPTASAPASAAWTATASIADATRPAISPVSPRPSPGASASAKALPAEPPPAALAVAGGATIAGTLGSYTWRTTGSDAPWIVGRSATGVARAARLTAAFGSTAPESWTAAWARVADGVAGPPGETVSGRGLVAVAAPDKSGDWSLRVTVVFGPAANATYFWHLVVR